MMDAELSIVLSTSTKLPHLLAHIASNYFGVDNGQSTITALRFASLRLYLPVAEKYFHHASYFSERDYKIIAALLGEVPKLRRMLSDWADHYDMFGEVKVEFIEPLQKRCEEIADAITSISWFDSDAPPATKTNTDSEA